MSNLKSMRMDRLQAVDRGQICEAFSQAASELVEARGPGPNWTGELSSSALSTATAISGLSVVIRARRAKSLTHEEEQELDRFQNLVQGGLDWLLSKQNNDGGWGDTELSYSNISTSMLVLAAIELAEAGEGRGEQIQRAESYVKAQGGIPGLRARYGKDKTFAVPILSNCAIAGQVDWREVSPLPFEAAWVPQRFYRWLQLPVVSYAIPALVAIGQARFFHRKPRNPIARLVRSFAVAPTLKVLERMQPGSGGYLEAIPLTCFVIMGLASTGRESHEVTRAGLRFVESSVRADGSWPIDTNLATWNTTLSINALAGRYPDQQSLREDSLISEALHEKELLDWLLKCQYHEVHPFTGAAPGGWGWSDLSGAVPDADDTPGALLALSELVRLGVVKDLGLEPQVNKAAIAGLRWLLDLQNSDGGWPTFCRGWGKLPFDRSGTDLTAHVLRSFQAWRELIAGDAKLASRVERAKNKGLRYVSKGQQQPGSWIPLWFGNQDVPQEENPVYGTSKVLYAYRDLGLVETQAAQRGLDWLTANQNLDGGWGGGRSLTDSSLGESSNTDNQRTVDLAKEGEQSSGNSGSAVRSSVEETALAVEAMLSSTRLSGNVRSIPSSPDGEAAIGAGLNWLCNSVAEKRHGQCSPIGFYFAKLWYYEKLYPQMFTVSALGRACREMEP